MTDQAGVAEEEALGKAYDARLMRRLLRYLKPYVGYVALALLVLLLASGTAVVGPWITQIVIDEAIPDGDTRLLTVLMIAYIVTTVLAFALEYAQTIVTTWLGQSVMYDLRSEIFDKLQRIDLKFYDRNPVGRLMTRMTNDVETLNNLFSSGVVTVFGDLFTLGFIVTAMLLMSWPLALVSFSVLPLVIFTAFLFRARVREAYRDIRLRIARVNSFLHERITGVRVVQLFNREEADARKLAELNDAHLQAHLRSITYYAIFFPVIQLFTALALALIIWYGGARMLDDTMSVGVITAFLLYARRFFRPIQDLSEKYNLLQAAMASSERVFKLLDEPIAIEDGGAESLPTASASPARISESTGTRDEGRSVGTGRITFDHVWFAYQDDASGDRDWVLRDVSFEIEPGEKVAVVGHTGAGKTTLVNLLMRFYEVDRGTIRIDDVPIDQLPLAELRGRVGLVLQDVFLFSQSVGYNIRLGSPEIDPARIREAAERVGADQFIRKLDSGYEQALGERGTSLSVGERQLVSFARALAFDPEILVLDEATSSIDSEIEERIEQATDELLRDRTSLVIAHRLSTVQNADRIIVLHHGRLEEIGTHQELLDHDGLYARLHELQFATLTG